MKNSPRPRGVQILLVILCIVKHTVLFLFERNTVLFPFDRHLLKKRAQYLYSQFVF
uniref:Uncharacterized protein n=1 Tax=Anguilla anguilla TaxID=7936 RepID=A0A0E9X076_ANGAN